MSSSYYNRDSRHLPPTNTINNDKSPLRSSVFQTSNYNTKDYQNEEDEYNKRRQEALKKSLQQQQHSPLRNKPYLQQNKNIDNYSFRTSDKYGSLERYQTIPEREKLQPSSSNSHFTLGPQIREEGLYEAPPHVKEHMANIQSDNSSLMRRLNLVIQELDRVKREKEDLQDRLRLATKDAGDLHRMINGEDNIDKVNKYMQDDLIYERERNNKIKQQIKELDLYKSELIRELRHLQEQQDNIVSDNQQLTLSLQTKISQIQDLEREHYFTQEKIKALNASIDNLRRENNGNEIDNKELHRIVTTLMDERNELLEKLDHLTRKYDECVREISQDRADMEAHNKQHAKLITSKIMFQQLEQIHRNRLQHGFKEFKNYFTFDNRCHSKLDNFGAILDKLGKFKQRQALRNWFKNGLKPINARKQSKQLAAQCKDNSLKYRMFYTWLKVYQQRTQFNDNKAKSIQVICAKLQKDAQVETKRAFDIWKEVHQTFKLKQNRVKKLLWKLYFNKLNLSFNAWVHHSNNLDLQVRLNLLSKKFSHKQFLTMLFNNFRYQIYDSKRKRQNILFHCLKAWKDHLQYQKFLMGTNMQALQFRVEYNTNIVKQCFDSLRQYKEAQKYKKTHQILTQEELPKINELTTQNGQFVSERQLKAKQRACESVKVMMSKQLYTYFQHWSQGNENYKTKLKTTVKDKIIQLYNLTVRNAFNTWKVNHDTNKVEGHQMIVNELQSDQQNLQNEVLSISKELEAKNQQKDQSQKKNVHKCVLSYQKRMKQLAIGRWRDRVTELNFREDGAATIIRRLRLRFLRKAFDLYLAGSNYRKKLQIEEERCKYYNKTRNERLKRTVFHAWTIFRKNHTSAKNYWYRIFLRLELTMKQSAVKKWKEVTQRKVERELQQIQHNAVENIDQLNNQIGHLHQTDTDQKLENNAMRNQLGKQAQRIISNAFARYYYVNETRGFEKWKEYLQFEKHKERLLRKFIDHWKKYQFYYVKSTFKNWILNANITERKEQLKKEEMKFKDTNHQFDMQTKLFESMKLKLANEIELLKQEQAKYNQRLQKSVQMIVNKVDGNHCMTNKRYIFLQWREYVKREVQFINCIKNVIQKSLWQKAFNQIRTHSRSVQKDTVKCDILNKFRMKFWKRTCGNAFSVWRSGAFKLVSCTVEEVIEETNQTISDFESKKEQIKTNNAVRSERIIKKNNLRNLFASWKNVTQFLKLQNAKDDFCKEQIVLFQKRHAVHKWASRNKATKLARVRSKRLKEKVQRIRLRQYFYALRDQFQITKDFCLRMGNLANIHNHQGLKMSFNAIISFAKSKNFVHNAQKEKSSLNLEGALRSILNKKMMQYFTELKMRSLQKNKIEQTKAYTILRCIGNQMRAYFLKWKEESVKKTLTKELHEEGPIREDIFDKRNQLINHVNFMTKEGYSDSEIYNALREEKERQKGLINKAVQRMKHFNEDLYQRPKAFDRWREYVHKRKLYRYWLNFIDKKGAFVQSDLHWGFEKWKNFYPTKFKVLQKLSKKELDKRAIKNSRILEQMAGGVDENESIVGNLEGQREQLIEIYVKGQRLALAIFNKYRQRQLHIAFKAWMKNAKDHRNIESLTNLRKNIDMLQQMKDKIRELEVENDTLANENEELRQFSLDGYEIAKNVQSLTAEREKFSVDLADKANMIRKLLDENERLTSKLKFAQDEAQSMIRSTMAGSTGFKTGQKSFPSQTMRNSNYY